MWYFDLKERIIKMNISFPYTYVLCFAHIDSLYVKYAKCIGILPLVTLIDYFDVSKLLNVISLVYDNVLLFHLCMSYL